MILFIAMVIVAALSWRAVHAGTLSCSVTTAAACTGTGIWRMSGASNAHAELPSQATAVYDSNVVCCSGVSGIGTSCAGTFVTALQLSGTTNAHAEQNSQSNYANNVCISVPSGGSVSIGYQSTNCSGFDTTLASISGTTNAHVGNSTAYTTKICGTASAATATVSCSTSISSTSFGTLDSGSIFTSSPNASTTMTCGGTGCALYIKDAGGGGNPGLYNTTSSALIRSPNTALSATSTLVAGTEGYGIQATTTTSGSGGTLTIVNRYRTTGNSVGGLLLSDTILASSTSAVTGREVVVTHKAAVSGGTYSGTYLDTITYSCVLN